MEAEIELDPFGVYKDCVSGSWLCTSGKFNKKLKRFILFFFDERLTFEIFSQNFRQKIKIKSQQSFFVFENQINNIVNDFNIL